MTGKLSKNFHGVGIGPLSKILAVKITKNVIRYNSMRELDPGSNP